MKVEIVANGTVSFALIPENDMDRAAMKMLLKQNNEFVEITKQTQILNKASFTEGLVIQPKARENAIGSDGMSMHKQAVASGREDIAIKDPATEQVSRTFEAKEPGAGTQIGGSRLDD
jgi:hypothetical protein